MFNGESAAGQKRRFRNVLDERKALTGRARAKVEVFDLVMYPRSTPRALLGGE
jgi:hypothetical protein